MIADSRTFAFDYSKSPLPEEAFRNIADVGVRYRTNLTHLDIHGTWDTNISSEGIVYIAHACEGTKEDQTSLIACFTHGAQSVKNTGTCIFAVMSDDHKKPPENFVSREEFLLDSIPEKV